ncbi:hypothetical protein V5O48_005508 [Marasmius crinis-equi]|uniref:AB hydrolase-1 domain-containing protein n=1 Tax=Marasmius crinis-equi TaxID=585013 RepID=A0ABR3FM32_9AGAR
MDCAAYKDLKTSRGLDYHYYFSPASEGKRTLVFLHGFPSTSYDWRHQAQKGYGLIVPDMLGYGGTAKPLDPAEYKLSLISKDIIDILDAEKIDQAVVIGHDWGSRTTSRVVQYFPERVSAFGVLAVGYQPPNPDFDFQKVLAFTKGIAGYEFFGYWGFFNEDDSAKLCEENFEKFFNLVFPEDPKSWISDLAPTGALRNYFNTKAALPSPSWLTAEVRFGSLGLEKRIHSEELRKGGLAAPTHWYKYILSRHNVEDDQGIPADRYKTDKPAFVGAATQDYIATAAAAVQQSQALCSNLTVKEFQANHWVQLQKADEVNRELEAWLKGL